MIDIRFPCRGPGWWRRVRVERRVDGSFEITAVVEETGIGRAVPCITNLGENDLPLARGKRTFVLLNGVCCGVFDGADGLIDNPENRTLPSMLPHDPKGE